MGQLRDRSRYFTSQGVDLIRAAMQQKGWIEEDLANAIDARTKKDRKSDSSIYESLCKYLSFQRPPQKKNIILIANLLGLNPRDLVDGWDKSVQSIKPHFDIENLVPEVRTKLASMVMRECGTMKVLSMSQPIDIGEIYTAVNRPVGK